jgi:ferric-dicitrate binding protein FerR (iron transport regulator)
MTNPAPEPDPGERAAERLFAEFLDRIESGEPVDFASWVAAHPEHRECLQRIHRTWQALQSAFTSLSEGE